MRVRIRFSAWSLLEKSREEVFRLLGLVVLTIRE